MHLAELTHVFDGDDSLGREGLDQNAVVVVERMNGEARDAEGPNRLALMDQGDSHEAVQPVLFYMGDPLRIAGSVEIGVFQIVNQDRTAFIDRHGKRGCSIKRPPHFSVFGMAQRGPVMRGVNQLGAILAHQSKTRIV